MTRIRKPGKLFAALWLGALMMGLLSLTSVSAKPGDADTGQTTAVPRIHLTAVMGGENLVTLPVLYGRAGGLFEKAGLDVKWLPVTQNAQISLVDTGAADFAQGTVGLAFSAQAVGKDIVVFAMVAKGFFNQLVLTNDAIKKLPPSVSIKSSVRDRLQAIKGMTIGTANAGTSTDLAFRAMLEQAGVDPDKDLTVVPNGDVADLVPAARAGRLDGFFTSPPNTSVAIQQGWGKQWVDMSSEIDLFRDAPATVLFAKRSTFKNNPEALRRVAAVLKQAISDIRNRPDFVRDTVKPVFFEHIDAKTFALAFDSSRKLFDHDMIVSNAGYEQAANSLHVVDVSGKTVKIPYDKIFDFSPLKTSTSH